MSTVASKNKHEILMKYKSKEQKRKAINELIDIVLENDLPYDEIAEAKEDARLLAESLLRSNSTT